MPARREPAVTLPPFDRFGAIERVPINKLGRVSAANLTVAWQTVPHVTQHELADVTELEEARQGYVTHHRTKRARKSP